MHEKQYLDSYALYWGLVKTRGGNVKSKVSALMDGELEKQDASNVIEALRKTDELQQEWKNYHLIGDALRQSSRLSMNISFHVNQKLESEPITALFPDASKIFRRQKPKVFALSVAASMMVMITAWIMMDDTTSEPQQSIVAENSTQDNNVAVVPEMISPPTSLNNYPPVEINDYLSVHREFSPGTDMRGQVTNVNSTEYREKHGR